MQIFAVLLLLAAHAGPGHAEHRHAPAIMSRRLRRTTGGAFKGDTAAEGTESQRDTVLIERMGPAVPLFVTFISPTHYQWPRCSDDGIADSRRLVLELEDPRPQFHEACTGSRRCGASSYDGSRLSPWTPRLPQGTEILSRSGIPPVLGHVPSLGGAAAAIRSIGEQRLMHGLLALDADGQWTLRERPQSGA